MNLSEIILNDPKKIRVDESGKSVGLFCRRLPGRVDKALIEALKRMHAEYPGKNIRLCLHREPEAPFHSMIILEKKGKYYPPHKHLVKGESFHIIEGRMAIFIFDDDGLIQDACILEKEGCFLYRIGLDMYHAVMPLSDVVIYHESKPGPFTGEGDSLYPAWAPDEHNADEIRKYEGMLLKTLNG
jgi:glucose-6-phosphate isomerase